MKEQTVYPRPVAAPLRFLATLVSYLFHPIFLVPMMAAYLIYGVPELYLGVPPDLKFKRLIIVTVNVVFYPLFALVLMKGLGFIKSIHLRSPKDRIAPYIVTLTCYFWAWMVVRSFPDTPVQMIAMIFGVFLATSGGLVINSFIKISMHAIGVGGLITFMLIMAYSSGVALPLTLSVLIAGLVFTARMMVSDHTDRELITGFVVGILGQVIGFLVFAR